MPYRFYLSNALNCLLFTTVRTEVEGDDSAGIGTGFFLDYWEPEGATADPACNQQARC